MDNETGEVLTEVISDTLIAKVNQKKLTEKVINNEPIITNDISKDDGWFSGLFPSYKESPEETPFNRNVNKKPTVIKNNSPIIVKREANNEKVSFWDKLKFRKKLNTGSKDKQGIINEKDIKVPLPKDENLVQLQKKYIPPKIENIDLNIADDEYNNISQTQLSDTNDVEVSIVLNQKELGYNRFKDLQEKFIPTPIEDIIGDTLSAFYYTGSSTQSSDTNIVEAWFNNENIISEEYDSRFLQEKYIPLEKNRTFINPSSDSDITEASPQIPEYTAPFILDERFKAQYKNKSKLNRPKRKVETPFEPSKKEENTWLSYFPLQSDSIKTKLKWDSKKEKEVSRFLQKELESLDYSPSEDLQYSWRSQLSKHRPDSYPPRYSDPGFRYYRQGGIKVETNLRGVPIYIDGKYIGDTPITRPIEVEPGWHQVSGFSPVYTHLASKKGLQFVGYDSIIQNNEMYGSTTVYAEAGKLETVSLKFNQMGDVPKKLNEINGGMSLGIPMFTLLIGLVTWAM